MSSTIETMKPACEQDVDRAVSVLVALGRKYGLSNFRHAAEPGAVVADVEPGRTYFDLVGFESEVNDLLGFELEVISAGSPDGKALARREVRAIPAA